jgi:hypothetical protein
VLGLYKLVEDVLDLKLRAGGARRPRVLHYIKSSVIL